MLLLLYRSMLGDLLRVGVLTTGVLVTVTAFGAAVKPLANDDLVSATQTVRYVALAIVPMLQFSLPFAFGFAATLSMHRMAVENEILAMAVAGISYRRILAPVAVLGLALAVVMVLLTQSLVPRFWALMQQTLAEDVTRLFESSIRRGLPFVMGDLQILADELKVIHHPPDTDVDTRFILFNAVAAETDKKTGVVSDVTARQMAVDLYRQGSRRFLKLVLTDAVVYNGRSGELGAAQFVELQRAIEIPDAFSHNLAFLGRADLVRLRDHPGEYPPVRQIMDRLTSALREQAAWEQMGGRFAAGETVEFRNGDQRRFVIAGDHLEGGVVTAGEGRVVRVEEFEGDTLVGTFESSQIKLSRVEEDPRSLQTFDAVLPDARVSYPRAHADNERARRVLTGLVLPEDEGVEWPSQTSAQLLERASKVPAGSEAAAQASRLRHKLGGMRLEITSRLSRRYALSAMAPLLLVLGAALAMWRRQSLPLPVFLWAFVPAILDVVLLSGGAPVVEDGHLVLGLAVMWSGNALLAILLAGVFLKLIRN